MSRHLFLAAVVILSLVFRVNAAPLPQDHDYQKVLRNYLASLTEADFTLKLGPIIEPTSQSDEDRFLDWLTVRADTCPFATGFSVPPSAFLLSSIEAGDKLMRPTAIDSELARFARQNPRGVVLDPRAFRLRSFVGAAIDLVMLDHLIDTPEGASVKRNDFLGGTLIWLAYCYREAKPDLPEPVRIAYETGLRRMVANIKAWGPRGIMTDMDLFAPVGLAFAGEVLNDESIRRFARDYSRRLFTDPHFFNPAGYFVDCGCFDVSYNGISLYYAAWSAAVSEWGFNREALDRGYKLRDYLSLPEPPAVKSALPTPLYFGPSHMSSRTSNDSYGDQWGHVFRHYGAAMSTDWALPLANLPPADELAEAPRVFTQTLQKALDAKEPIASKPWREHHWSSYNFALDHLKPGLYARFVELKKQNSPLLKLPFDKPGRFIERFGDTFVVAKFDRYGVVIHTGTIAGETTQLKKPYGFSGGAVSAFWTPETGAAVLGRRRGAQGDVSDSYDEWRLWPVHAITGATSRGKFVSSARCAEPKATFNLSTDSAIVTIAGAMPKTSAVIGELLAGEVAYTRRFTADNSGLTVESAVKSDGKDEITELYEVVPLFIRDERFQRAADQTLPKFGIEFRVGDAWVEAGAQPREGVTAVRVSRHLGAVRIEFDEPRRVRLSPEEWRDGYQTQAVCRNVMIDLMQNTKTGQPASASVKYRIVPETK